MTIHLFSILLVQSGLWGKLEPIPAGIGQKVGYTLNRSSICHRANTEKKQPFTPMGNLEEPLNLIHRSLDWGRKPQHLEAMYGGMEENMQILCRKAPVDQGITLETSMPPSLLFKNKTNLPPSSSFCSWNSFLAPPSK